MRDIKKGDLFKLPLKADNKCFLCIRIDSEEYLRELRKSGFEIEEARTIVNWIKQIYEANPSFLCGRSGRTIKASLAYIGAILLKKDKTREPFTTKLGFHSYREKYSQRYFAEHFNCTMTALRTNYQRTWKFMWRMMKEELL